MFDLLLLVGPSFLISNEPQTEAGPENNSSCQGFMGRYTRYISVSECHPSPSLLALSAPRALMTYWIHDQAAGLPRR